MTTIRPAQAADSPSAKLLDYPRTDPERIASIATELSRLGVEQICLQGPVQAAGQPVLGLGYCGVVLLGCLRGQPVAIKVRRSDSTQAGLHGEADSLRLANRIGIGPQLYAASADILVMEYLPGSSLGDWLRTPAAKERGALTRILTALLQAAFRLDQAGLDHGALRSVSEHAIVANGRATLIDFSHASSRRRPANVTTLLQGLFWGTRLAEKIGHTLPLPKRSDLLPLLQRYKQAPAAASFQALLQALPR